MEAGSPKAVKVFLGVFSVIAASQRVCIGNQLKLLFFLFLHQQMLALPTVEYCILIKLAHPHAVGDRKIKSQRRETRGFDPPKLQNHAVSHRIIGQKIQDQINI